MRTIFVMTAAVALLVGTFRACGASAESTCAILAFLLVVAFGQMFLYKGQKPRAASVVSGAAAMLLYGLVRLFFVAGNWPNLVTVLVILFAPVVAIGVVAGYCCGTLVAGVFLVMDVIEKRIGRQK